MCKIQQLNGQIQIEYKPKLNDDNNNVIFCDNRSTTSEVSSECSSLSESDKGDGEGFHYRTMNGKIIKSVIPPGKGIKVDYKVRCMFFSVFIVVFQKAFLCFTQMVA